MTESMRTENEIQAQIYACVEWKNVQQNPHLVAQGDTEIKVLEWVLNMRDSI